MYVNMDISSETSKILRIPVEYVFGTLKSLLRRCLGGSNIYSPGIWKTRVWVFPKIGVFSPKIDGGNNGSKPYEQMDDLGVALFLETPIFGQISSRPKTTGPDFPPKGTYRLVKYDDLARCTI